MITFTRSGNGADPWCSLAPHQSGWMAVWSQPGLVEFEEASGNRIIRPVPTDFLRYVDADGNGTEAVAIGVGGDDHAYLVSTARTGFTDLGLVSGNFAVAVFWNGATFVPILVTGPDTYTIDGNPRQIPIGVTSQGIRQLLNDVIIWGDETHVREVAGRGIHKYSHIGPVFAGQRNGSDHIDLHNGAWHTVIVGPAQPPKMTLLHDGRIGVAAATNRGAVFAIGPPWPDLIPDTTPPPPVDPPPVEPSMDFPRAEWAVVEEMHDRFSDMFPATEDGARSWTEMTIEQLAFSFPSGGWCWKRADPGRPPSKDSIARQTGGRFEGWDVLSSAGVTGPRVLSPYPPAYHDLAGQVPIPVTAKNHLGGVPPDPPDPPDEDQDARIKALEVDVEIMQQKVLKLEDRVLLLETSGAPGGVTAEQVQQIVQDSLDKAVDGDLRMRFYTLVGKLRELKSTSSTWGIRSHSHTIIPFEGDF